MNIDILHRDTGVILYTATLPDDAALSQAQHLGFAVQQAMRAGVSLVGAELCGADFTGTILMGVDFTGAYLIDAIFIRADLTCTNFTGADLTRANFKDAKLRAVIFTRANLTCVDLHDVIFTAGDFTGANFTNVQGFNAPVVPELDAAILAELQKPGCRLDMQDWHSCATTHCRAGWAVHLAGEAGAKLERQHGPGTAGALIYLASVGYVPDFYASNEEALRDITEHAAKQRPNA